MFTNEHARGWGCVFEKMTSSLACACAEQLKVRGVYTSDRRVLMATIAIALGVLVIVLRAIRWLLRLPRRIKVAFQRLASRLIDH